MRRLLHCAGLAGIALFALAACSTAPKPPPGFGPLPRELQVEIEAFYASLDRDLLNRDLEGLMLHYTGDAEYSYRAYYAAFDEHRRVHRDFDEIQWYYQLNLTALEADSIQELRKEFEYLPGVNPADFTIRYKSFPRDDSGEFPAEPFTEVTAKFRRTGGALQLHSVSAENLRAPDPPRAQPTAKK